MQTAFFIITVVLSILSITYSLHGLAKYNKMGKEIIRSFEDKRKSDTSKSD